MHARFRRPRLEAAEAVFDVREPIAALVYSPSLMTSMPMVRCPDDDRADGFAEIDLVIGRGFIELDQIRQAST